MTYNKELLLEHNSMQTDSCHYTYREIYLTRDSVWDDKRGAVVNQCQLTMYYCYCNSHGCCSCNDGCVENRDSLKRRVTIDIVLSVIVITLRACCIHNVYVSCWSDFVRARCVAFIALSALQWLNNRLSSSERASERPRQQPPQLCRCRRRQHGCRPRPNVPGQRRWCSMIAGCWADF